MLFVALAAQAVLKNECKKMKELKICLNVLILKNKREFPGKIVLSLQNYSYFYLGKN